MNGQGRVEWVVGGAVRGLAGPVGGVSHKTREAATSAPMASAAAIAHQGGRARPDPWRRLRSNPLRRLRGELILAAPDR